MKSISGDSRLVVSVVLGMAALACGGGNGDKPATKTCAKGEALVARPEARIFLTSSLLPRLKARRAAGEAAWTELAKTCDGLASGTVNAPSGPAYPNPPNLGQGYQGENYLPAIAALGLCYRTTSGTDEAAAARYGAAGARVLDAMSTPVSSGGQSPQTDAGYGIRNYGVGMALGYDWLYPALSASTRERVIGSLNTWIDWYDQSGFSRNHPIGNYFVGYLLSKTLTAIATEGENPKAASYFSDVSTRLWATLVKPAFTKSMTGGGWPEGWGYGPRAVSGVAEFLWAVKTGKNLDWGTELPQARDQARYLTHFAWPSLLRMDDQGTVRSGNALKPSAALVSALATILQRFDDPAAKQTMALGADIAAVAGDDRAPWQKFLYGDPALPQEPYTTQPLSYQASGPGHVAMRSSWQKTAVWAAFESGPYINSPDSGEQMFNAGNLSVVIGNNPIVINATGWLPQAAGTAGEDFVYQDSWGDGGRRLYNTFFVNDPTNPHNPGQNGTGPTESKTRVERYVDDGVFVRARAAQVENQYAPSVKQYNRDLVYLRPGTFVLFDRTTVADAGADQWLAFHTPSAPTPRAAADSSQSAYDVTSTTGNGNIRFLLPRQLSVKTVSLPGNATRLEAHASGAAERQWLTVIGAGETAPHVRLSAEDGNVHSGDVVGVHVKAARNQVVLFSKGHAPSSAISAAEYDVTPTADADHVLVDVADAPEGYAVSAAPVGGALRIKLTRGGPFRVSSAGTLHLVVKTSGAIEGPPAPPAPPPTGAGGSGGSGGAPGNPPPTGAGGTGGGSTGGCQPSPCGPQHGGETATKAPNDPARDPAPPESIAATAPPLGVAGKGGVCP